MSLKSMFLSWLRNKRHTFPGVLCLIVLMISGGVAFASTITGLDFPGSKGTSVRFRFLNPLAIYPATYIWRARPRAQPADWPTSSQYFYTTFFWSNDVGGSGVGPTDGSINNPVFQWDGGSANTYYGAHPYPQGTPDGGNPPNYGAPFTASTVKWEIATDGFDWTSAQSVGFDQWYTQAFVAWADENGFKHTAFYWDLSDPTRVITHTTYPSYGNTMPPVAALTFGDAPWHQGWEVYDGVLRGFRIYSTNLSLSDIQKEADSPLSTDAGKTNIWYLNMNPTQDDISDKSGKGHNPEWVGGGRAATHSEPDTTPPPADTTPPVTTISLSGPQGTNGWYTGPVTVTLTANDPDGASDVAATNYRLDGGAITPYTGAFRISTDRVHSLEFASKDRAGNVEATHSVTIKIDATPPKITCTVSPSILWPPNHKLIPVTVTVLVSDVLSGPAGFVLQSVTSMDQVKERGGGRRDDSERDDDKGDKGKGENNTAPDIQGFIPGTASTQGFLRAERPDDGSRTYTFVYQGKDAAGNSASCTTTVVVPKDGRDR